MGKVKAINNQNRGCWTKNKSFGVGIKKATNLPIVVRMVGESKGFGQLIGWCLLARVTRLSRGAGGEQNEVKAHSRKRKQSWRVDGVNG
jgi:hypothetical protein